MALLDEGDGNHARAVAAVRRLAAERAVLVQTDYLQVETHGLLVGRAGHAIARRRLAARALPALPVSREVRDRAVRIIATHADRSFSLCDAISFAFIEASRIRRAFAFDRHFRQFGRFEVIP